MKNSMFRRLRNRILLITMSIITVVMAAAFSVVYTMTLNSIRDENKQRLTNEVFVSKSSVFLEQSAEHPGDYVVQETAPPWNYAVQATAVPQDYSVMATPLPQNPVIEYSTEDGAMFSISLTQQTDPSKFSVVTDEMGEILEVSSVMPVSITAIEPVVSHAYAAKEHYNSDKYSIVVRENNEYIYDIQEMGSALRITFLDVTESQRRLYVLLRDFIIVGVSMLSVIFIVSYFFSNRAIRPIAEAWGKQKRFIADASHELKTPLSIINANMDVLEMSGTPDAERGTSLDHMRQELARMGKLVGEMLYLAKAEGAYGLKAAAKPFNLSKVCEEASAVMEALIYENGMDFFLSVEDNCFVMGDEEEIKRAVLILLDNAVKYTEENGSIAVSLKKQRGNAVLRVINTGKGISAEDLPRIFDRFYRVDNSRAKETGGYGLGLSIAKAAAERSGGSISAESGNNKTIFEIVLKVC